MNPETTPSEMINEAQIEETPKVPPPPPPTPSELSPSRVPPPPPPKSASPPPPHPPMPMTMPTAPPPRPSAPPTYARPIEPKPQEPSGLSLWLKSLKTDLSNRTARELLGIYAKPLVGIALALLLAAIVPSIALTLATVGAGVALMMGMANPQRFRFVFGERTTKAMVCATFGAMLLLLMGLFSLLQPQ